MRDDAREYADKALRNAVHGLVGILKDAIDLRQAQPHRFALFHERMGVLLRAAGIRRGRKWHAWWARYYSAKAYALSPSLASACGLCDQQAAQGSE